jgi:hypothetical protein
MDKNFSVIKTTLKGTEGGGVTLCRQADTLLQTKILGIHDEFLQFTLIKKENKIFLI